MSEAPRSTSTEPPPVLTRVNRLVEEPAVPNTAHGSLLALRSWPKPAFWNPAPPNVAVNSSERPGPKAGAAVGLARAPSTLIEPPATVEPPGAEFAHSVDDQPLGRFVPENSEPTVGARVTSPPVESAMYVSVPGVPAPNSAAVESASDERSAAVVNVQLEAAASALPDASATDDATVATYPVSAARSADGSSVAVLVASSYETVAAMSAPPACGCTVNAEDVIVAGSIGSSHVSRPFLPRGGGRP